MIDEFLVIWIIGVIAFGIWGQIVIKEFFDAIERSQTRRAVKMSRCDYCEYRNCAECEDVEDRVANDVVCYVFKLDFDTLSAREKKTIQKRLMKGGEE